MKILAVGGSGRVGKLVVQLLLDKKVDVSVFSRKKNDEQIAQTVQGDLLEPNSVREGMKGISKLYLLNAVTADEVTQGLIAIDIAKEMKLKHVLYHSVFEAEKFPEVPHFAAKVVIETALKASGLPFTIIRPNFFTQNDLAMKEALKAGSYPTPLGEKGVSAVDIRDIAEASAISLTSDGHENKTYNLVGPEPLTGSSAAKLWTEALGKPVRYVDANFADWEEKMAKIMPPWSAFELRMMFQGYNEKGFAGSLSDVAVLEKLLGHAPRSYNSFVAEAITSWK